MGARDDDVAGPDRELRPLFVPPDPCQRTTYGPGELAQFDLWQPDATIPFGVGQFDKLWVVVGRDRVLTADHGGWMVPSRVPRTDVLGGKLHVLAPVRAAPQRGVGSRGLHRPMASGPLERSEDQEFHRSPPWRPASEPTRIVGPHRTARIEQPIARPPTFDTLLACSAHSDECRHDGRGHLVPRISARRTVHGQSARGRVQPRA